MSPKAKGCMGRDLTPPKHDPNFTPRDVAAERIWLNKLKGFPEEMHETMINIYKSIREREVRSYREDER